MARQSPERKSLMTKKQKEQVLKGLRKKDNMVYWDEIDDVVLEFLKKISDYSYTRVKRYYEEDDEDWTEYEEEDLEITDEFIWASNDVRDFVVALLEKDFKAWFPYVDEG
jgi:hypothetical protein